MAAAWLNLMVLMSILTIYCVSFVEADDVFVMANTTYGTLKGFVDDSAGIPVTKFYGIPFAKAPTGSLRFKAPMIPDKWNGVRDALQFGNECVQRPQAPNTRFFVGDVPPTQDEDCLFLNVYTSSPISKQGALPVMVWIHGGGLVVGSGSQYDATSLSTHGVIVVTLNYRLDSFGYLSTEDDVLPGNYGHLDQIAALKWVKENIATFGGDPNTVTIFGQSAGSASVSLLTLSPLAKGLFQRAIMESAVSLSPFGSARKGNKISPRILARLVGTMCDCDNIDNSTLLMACLQNVDAGTLLNASNSIELAVSAGTIWNARVETTFGFLPDLPINLLSRGEINHVDSIRGYNSYEMGPYFLTIPSNTTDQVFRSSLDNMLGGVILGQFTKLDQKKLLQIIDKSYFTWSSGKDAVKLEAGQSANDIYMVGPTAIEMSMFVPKAPEKKHYLYEFHPVPSWKKDVTPPGIYAAHGDELAYVFNVSTKSFVDNGVYGGQAKDVDIQISNQVMEMWTNFAKTGDPTSSVPKGGVQWKPYSLTSPNYLFIDETSEVKSWSRPRTIQLYDNVLKLLDGVSSGVSTDLVG